MELYEELVFPRGTPCMNNNFGHFLEKTLQRIFHIKEKTVNSSSNSFFGRLNYTFTKKRHDDTLTFQGSFIYNHFLG